jgi:anaerobic magnesium-protoporphyrin IX monomethyl ester cyclase
MYVTPNFCGKAMPSDEFTMKGDLRSRTHDAYQRPGEIDYLLINPPLTDPTQPYHSIPYLVGSARSEGFTAYRCVDANIDGLNYLADPRRVADLLQRAADIRHAVGKSASITRSDELSFRIALAGCGLAPDFVSKAISVFRSPDLFYHNPTYRQAVMAVQRWQELLSLDGAAGLFHSFSLRGRGLLNLCSFDDLTNRNALGAATRAFDPYIAGPFAETLAERPWQLIGFSVNYTSQLPFALRLAYEARALCPGAIIAFGGTDVCDVIRFTRANLDVWELFRDVDVIVPGEGETPFCDILRGLRDGSPLARTPGTLKRADRRDTVSINYENVATLPAPAYDVWDWTKYWSPEPVVLYSPTRGCYWNKCTFCDYGLNSDSPTSPFRERPADAVIDDLAAVREIGDKVYFAVDAMSPRYVRLLSEALSKASTQVYWGAELRLERTFPQRGVARLLRRAGCVAISFGYESASQRILDLIDKGVNIEAVPAILTDLGTNKIAAQMMGFTGFPSETKCEAERTYQFLLEHSTKWALAGITVFGLTPGSIIAKKPSNFGISLMSPGPGIDILRFVSWQEPDTGVIHRPIERDERISDQLRQAVNRAVDDRPFAGGIDSAHSLLYFKRNGPCFFAGDRSEDPLVEIVPVARCTVPFVNFDEFTTVHDLQEERDVLERTTGSSYDSMMSWLRSPGNARRGDALALILPSGVSIGLPTEANEILSGPLLKLIIHSAKARGSA